MTPNIAKSHKDTAKFFDGNNPASSESIPQSNATDSIAKMDGDHSAKTMEQGANKASGAAGGLMDGLHESTKQTPAAGEKMTGQGTSVFSKDGALGKHFNADGAIGGTAQSIGGPFDKQGMVGKHFNADGAIGGTAQDLAEKNEQH